MSNSVDKRWTFYEEYNFIPNGTSDYIALDNSSIIRK